MIRKGDKIDTNFSVDVVKNGEERKMKFSELLDRPSVVSVYMRNNTPGCDKQNRSLAGESGWFNSKGYNLIALSKDTLGSHRNYADKLDIDYTLVSDPDFKFAEATGSMTEKKMYGKTFNAPSRSAFIIDTDGRVIDYIEKIRTEDHAEELKELINQL